MDGIGIGSDSHEYDVPEPRPWGEQRSVPEGYEVRHTCLTDCPACQAEVDGLRAMRDRAQAIARSGSSESARATAAVILSAVTE